MDFYGMSDRAILVELGQRIRRRRLEKNRTQQEIAEMAGLDRTTVGEIERGSSASLLTLVQVLRALGALEELDGFLPDPGLSPLELAKMKGRPRQRASRRGRASGDDDPGW